MKISCQKIEDGRDNLIINLESEEIENIILIEPTKEAKEIGRNLRRKLKDAKDESFEEEGEFDKCPCWCRFIAPFIEKFKEFEDKKYRLFIIAPSGIYDYNDWEEYLEENFYENYLIKSENDINKLKISIFKVIFPEGLIPISWPEGYDLITKEFSPPGFPVFCLNMKNPEQFPFDINLKINLEVLSLREFSDNIEIKTNINEAIYKVTVPKDLEIKQRYKTLCEKSRRAFLDLEEKWKKEDKIRCPICNREFRTIFFCECKSKKFSSSWEEIIFDDMYESRQENFKFFIFIKKDVGTVEWFASNQKLFPVENTSSILKDGDSLYIISRNGTKKLTGKLGLYQVGNDIYILEAPKKEYMI